MSTTPRFQHDPITTRGTPRQRARRVPRDEREQRIETVRRLMAMGGSDGDVRRRLAGQWGLSRKSMGRYLALARKRNRESIGRSAEDALADSVSYWTAKLQEAESYLTRARKMWAAAEKRIDDAWLVLDNEAASPEERDTARDRLMRGQTAMDRARREYYQHLRTSMDCRTQIDKLLGVYAPKKIAHTDAKGRDVPQTRPAEPVSDLQANREIQELYESIRRRLEVERGAK